MMISARKVPAISGLLCGILIFLLHVTPAHAVFINEIHYDNVGADIGEGVEISGEAGVDLAGWSLALYNGSTSVEYSSRIALSGIFGDMQSGMGVLDFGILGIQNGAPDGIALVDNLGNVIQFLSYEGILTADSGVALGMTSSDIGVAETASTPAGYSLQLVGEGREYVDFSWAARPMLNTFGNLNVSQTFLSVGNGSGSQRSSDAISVPLPSSVTLLLLGLFFILVMRKFGLDTGLQTIQS